MLEKYRVATQMMVVLSSEELVRIVLGVKRVESISDMVAYIMLRGPWFHIIVVDIHVPIED
jgi:hypothetical protein